MAPESCARPGLTSLLRTARGLMTIQTEIVGNPARFVTIVDLAGRVLKTWESSPCLEMHDVGLAALARIWHQDIDGRIRANLERVSQRHSQSQPHGEALAYLFVAAMQAYAGRDLATARDVLKVCESLDSTDVRIRAALKRLSTAV